MTVDGHILTMAKETFKVSQIHNITNNTITRNLTAADPISNICEAGAVGNYITGQFARASFEIVMQLSEMIISIYPNKCMLS